MRATNCANPRFLSYHKANLEKIKTLSRIEGMESNQEKPLADRIRPEGLDDFVGQEHLTGPGRILRRLIEEDKVPSMIFWGPPGCGKTTLTRIVAKKTEANFISCQATEVGVAEIKKIMDRARLNKKAYQKKTIIFVDEIHRFNKAQQAVFLPYAEDGSIILIATTTENPSFEIISPLLSRCQLFIFEPLGESDLKKIVKRALLDKRNGLGNYKIKIKPKAIDLLIGFSSGDARTPLKTLETALKIASPDKQGYYHLDEKLIIEALQHKALRYDKKGEEHYNIISAFIKSMRGSDPDAALYWLSRMLEAGEDPRFMARRMVIFASEDIGNADPMALEIANAVARAVEFVGLPEAKINLAQGATYLACAPKSRASYEALLLAEEDVKKTLDLPVPLHLRNAPTKLMKELGYGKNYKKKQEYLPKKLKGKKYYQPPLK
ncbi:AAA family ATPase [bacterium (Candidatus Moisslbacteria) CG02_land_8_20_14_3_00_36_53]|nr:MAG: AAA family ATPase [bacterium (Candidatus Moisslbacteria) CG02_land_8_20_14_3_00_36_53]PIZ90353.1 MAG: AAA family ATPase [bacterium (Candidatus Moisslbacteria) CG_4_10_14_0_2_um_filter_36_61]